MNVVRRIVPYTLIPLAVLACALANSPWLRAFPAGVLAVPLFGAAVVSVLVPLVVIGIGPRQVWFTALVNVVIFVLYELLVVLRAPLGFGDLYDGLVHGPSQVLTFALPLVSPRTLLVAPVALCWLTGAIAGECIARGWQTFVSYAAMLVAFGLAYAATIRAVTDASDGHRYDTLLAAGLLLTMLLLRAAQAWVAQDNSAQNTEADSALPLRGLTIGIVLSVLVASSAVGVAAAFTSPGRPRTPARVPPLDHSNPLTPISFIAGLRPSDPDSKTDPVFSVTTDRASSNYISIGSVDIYDGDGWSFDRTFRPSGGIVPADDDPSLRSDMPEVTQNYTIEPGPFVRSPWMAYLYRPRNVSGVGINVDPASGMIVPSGQLGAHDSYTVQSTASTTRFDKLPKTALFGASSPADLQLPGNNVVTQALSTLAQTLSQREGVATTNRLAYLGAVASDFKNNFALADTSTRTSATPPPSASGNSSSRPPSTASPSVRPNSGRTPPPQRAGSTTFADVLVSIREFQTGTPEQYATLTCLIARSLGIPARLATGFKLPLSENKSSLAAGTYHVTTAEAYTWVEIPISGVGWVVLDPSPQKRSDANRDASASGEPSATPTNTPTGQATITQAPSGGRAVAPPGRFDQGNQTSILMIVLVVAGAIAALLLLLALLQLLRRQLRKRRRRRSGDPRRRLLGAWQESLDMLEESGMPDLTHSTSREVSEQTGARFGGETGAQARFLGDAANTAIFSPTSWIGPAEADTAWRTQAVLTRSVRDRLTWQERVRARLRYHSPGGRRRRASYAFYASKVRGARHRTTRASR